MAKKRKLKLEYIKETLNHRSDKVTKAYLKKLNTEFMKLEKLKTK